MIYSDDNDLHPPHDKSQQMKKELSPEEALYRAAALCSNRRKMQERNRRKAFPLGYFCNRNTPNRRAARTRKIYRREPLLSKFRKRQNTIRPLGTYENHCRPSTKKNRSRTYTSRSLPNRRRQLSCIITGTPDQKTTFAGR